MPGSAANLLSEDEIRRMVESFEDTAQALSNADATQKASNSAGLGISATARHTQRRIMAVAGRPSAALLRVSEVQRG